MPNRLPQPSRAGGSTQTLAYRLCGLNKVTRSCYWIGWNKVPRWGWSTKRLGIRLAKLLPCSLSGTHSAESPPPALQSWGSTQTLAYRLCGLHKATRSCYWIGWNNAPRWGWSTERLGIGLAKLLPCSLSGTHSAESPPPALQSWGSTQTLEYRLCGLPKVTRSCYWLGWNNATRWGWSTKRLGIGLAKLLPCSLSGTHSAESPSPALQS